MAVLTGPTIVASSPPGTGTKWALLGFQKVTAADTFDVSTLTTIAPFQTVFAALGVAVSNRTETVALATIAGTNLTINGTGIAADSVLLFVVGT